MGHPERTMVTGAGLAGLRTIQALRERGYASRITLIGAEDRPPYDRPPLSKKVLTDGVDPSLHADFAALDVDFRPGEIATSLDGTTLCTNHGEYPWDSLVVATGAVPVALPGPGPQRFLRTLDDALALRAMFRPGLRLAIVGAGWIGAELATAASAPKPARLPPRGTPAPESNCAPGPRWSRSPPAAWHWQAAAG
jgi:NADPH-dependent 2,4-dienoyl-CoA reductase/sulfur reductase-like enzyme